QCEHASGPLHALAAHLGYTCTRATPDQSGGDPVDAFMRLQVAEADLARALADPLSHAGEVTRNEMRRAEAMATEVQAALGHALAALRGRMRAAPEVGY
ncbi:MAG: phage regulatory CII family protein, partial [Giesbergeria sp.]